MKQVSICQGCNKQCILEIEAYDKELDITGNECSVGIDYANYDLNNSKKIFTSLVRIKGSNKFNVLPVKSSEPIDKKIWIECSKALSRIYVGPPIKLGDIVCKNILNTGVDILSCRTITRD